MVLQDNKQGESVSQQTADSKPIEISLQQLKRRLQAKSANTRRTTKTILDQLEQLNSGNRFDRLTYWYYLTFCTGFGYVFKTPRGMQTNKGWLLPDQVRDYLGRGAEEPKYLAIKPSDPESCWVAVDIDTNSRYHPASVYGEGIEPVLEALARIGLNQAVWFQSSWSTGIHLWFPLAQSCRTWGLAVELVKAIQASNLELKDGVLELRPNTKGFNSSYKAIRAPLTGEGNAIWIENYDLVEEPSVLKQMWEVTAAYNILKPIIQDESVKTYSSNRRGHCKSGRSLQDAVDLLAEGFTGSGQTQKLKLAALQQARLIEGIDSLEELDSRAHTLIEEAPGFEKYCGHQREVSLRQLFSRRELKATLELKPGGYSGTWKETANLNRSENAKERAELQLHIAEKAGLKFANETAAIRYLANKGGPARSWWKKKANTTLCQELRQKLVENGGGAAKISRGRKG